MRRKLTTPDTWNVIAAIIAIALVVVGGMWLWNSGKSSSQEAFIVKQADGKILVSTNEWATAQANNTKFATLFPGHDLTLDTIVTRKLEEAEAEKRGTTCTTAEAVAQLKGNGDTALAGGDADVLKAIFYSLEVSGHAPAGYSLTPEAERTPALADAVKAYEADPKIIEGFRRQCNIVRLYTSLAPDGDNRKRNDAISGLRSKLHVDAGLEYSTVATATPSVTDTPAMTTATTTPTP